MAFSLSSTSSPHTPVSIDAEKLEQNKIWQRVRGWLGKEEPLPCQAQKIGHQAIKPSLGRRLSRKVVPGLPRPGTFQRQNSERREKLTPVDTSGAERRAQSMDRRKMNGDRSTSWNSTAVPKMSAPALSSPEQTSNRVTTSQSQDQSADPSSRNPSTNNQQQHPQRPMPPPSPPPEDQIPPPNQPPEGEPNEEEIEQELEDRWILNLSMHFRDRSPREKFFVTYAETPTRWRRVTVSCDYRDAPPDSLERDLEKLQYQRDKSARIYEAIRTSLPDIQFYNTVTNLRLETSDDDRLHVHVTEDVNEIIPYPTIKDVQHLDYKRVSECDVVFDSHMSGFVYRVRINNQDFNNKTCIKKEIPGPDSVEEFLYEVNALYSLEGTRNVISFEGLVVDEESDVVKGLLISYAEQGPLVDMIYDFKHTEELTWLRREKWARGIILGLSQIHDAGFVQGDFTLSNIVIDDADTAQIIDINRRGCPVGWEPPEIHRMIESGQRISMYIGVKSDLFQLGMVLWGLAMKEDEPERQPRPLRVSDFPAEIPQFFKDIASICLSEKPKERWAAKDLLGLFPSDFEGTIPDLMQTASTTRFIDPAMAVEREDLDLHSRHRPGNSYGFSDAPTYIGRPSSLEMPFDGPGSYMVSRGRSPPRNVGHIRRGQTFPLLSSHRPRNNGTGEPQIVPIGPAGPLNLDDNNTDGRDWDMVDSEEDEEEREQRQKRRRERMHDGTGVSPKPSTFEHVDSGLADMDLAGIGENDMLKTRHNALDLAREIDNLNKNQGWDDQQLHGELNLASHKEVQHGTDTNAHATAFGGD